MCFLSSIMKQGFSAAIFSLFLNGVVGVYTTTSTVETTTIYWPTVTDTSGDSVEVTTFQQFEDSDELEEYYVIFYTELISNQSELCPSTLRIYERLVDLDGGSNSLNLEECWARYGDMVTNSTLNTTDMYFEFRGPDDGEVFYSGSFDEYNNAMDELSSTETIPFEARVFVKFHLAGSCPTVPYSADVEFIFGDKHDKLCPAVPAPTTVSLNFTIDMPYSAFLDHIIDGYNAVDKRNILLHSNENEPNKARIILVLFQSNNEESYRTFSRGISQNSSEYDSVMKHYSGQSGSQLEEAKIQILCQFEIDCFSSS